MPTKGFFCFHRFVRKTQFDGNKPTIFRYLSFHSHSLVLSSSCCRVLFFFFIFFCWASNVIQIPAFAIFDV